MEIGTGEPGWASNVGHPRHEGAFLDTVSERHLACRIL